jgi:hypothetical protein
MDWGAQTEIHEILLSMMPTSQVFGRHLTPLLHALYIFSDHAAGDEACTKL